MDALDVIPRSDVRDRLIASCPAAEQPPLLHLPALHLHAAIGSLAIGGAERIVLDWAQSASRRHRVRLIVLRRPAVEWPLPVGVELVRLDREELAAALEREGAYVAASGNRQVLCHLLSAAERAALERGGAQPIPVLHNASQGWLEPAAALAAAPWSIAVSQAASDELHALGVRNVSVVRHIPAKHTLSHEVRSDLRARWQIPDDAYVIGMIGGVKPQKAYPRALRIFATLLKRRDAYLVILGGPTGREGLRAWDSAIAQCQRLEICDRVRMPGFVPDAVRALAAFDMLLNTSNFEGLSIATLEALSAGLAVVASRVGGQGELDAPALRLVEPDAPVRQWIDALSAPREGTAAEPAWRGFPAPRVWTLMHLPSGFGADAGTLFVTANLNAGGAQRSLVNLAVALRGSFDFEIAVCGNSTASAFTRQLSAAGVRVWRTTESRDALDHAEALLRYAALRGHRTIVFWNVDAKVKLLVVKRLEHSAVRLIDVSPGAHAFEEMQATTQFQTCIAYPAARYYARLQRLVMKYDARPSVIANIQVIRNGVPAGGRRLRRASPAPRSIVVSGRIAPSKFVLEIVLAMRSVWRHVSEARLHVLGGAEPRHHAYLDELLQLSGDELDRRIFLHGPTFDAPQRLQQFDVALVIGRHQGCPNAVLEAMAAGLPVVANDSGGTSELVIDGRTGVLVADAQPDAIASGLLRLLTDPRLCERLSRAAQRHVARRFSMRAMSVCYRQLLAQ